MGIEKKTKINRRMYSEVQKRMIAHKQQWKCVGEICTGIIPLTRTWNLDHVVPLWKGGLDSIHNLQIICSECHSIKTQRERVTFYFEKRLKDSPLLMDDKIKVSIYYHKDQRWRVIFPKKIHCKSKYFSSKSSGSIEAAKQDALTWCNQNNLAIKYCSKINSDV
jgi:hypothetical protein